MISLDVQFLPDVEIPCPTAAARATPETPKRSAIPAAGEKSYTLPELMGMDVASACTACDGLKLVRQRLQVLQGLGLGYLTLGEATPSLSGGEAQRLKLASEMGRGQSDSVFVFDEPTIGLHPLDVQTLLGVFRTLIENGATVIVIEHDLDVIRSADYILDMGPGGGEEGGRLVPPARLPRSPRTRTASPEGTCKPATASAANPHTSGRRTALFIRIICIAAFDYSRVLLQESFHFA